MPDLTNANRVVRFGAYEVDLAAGRLHRGGTRIKLREKSFQVLAALLDAPGSVVTREELQRRLWPEGVFVDFDNNLNAAVARLRDALGDRVDRPRFIETLPKHGYRFIAPVTHASSGADGPTSERPRLLVLPFLNLSGDPAQECFSDAMTDEVITELAKLAPERLAVLARTTAMHYKHRQDDVAAVRRELGVDYVVEGAVRRDDGRVDVSVQLIRASDQSHAWAQRYRVGETEVPGLQEQIARAVGERLGLSPPGARAARTLDLVAYNHYIQGRHHLAGFSCEALARARRHLEAAIARDPQFALAYDSLAEVFWWLGYFGFVRPVEAFSAGVLHAVRALELDGSLAETHALLAQYHKQLRYDWPNVERGMARAMALNSNSPVVRVRYAWNLLMPLGRLDDAIREFEAALDLDPLSTYSRAALTITLVLSRQFDRARVEARQMLDLDPTAYWGHLAIGASHLYGGRMSEAIAAERKAVEVSGGSPAMLGWLGMTLGFAGRQAEARGLFTRLLEMSGRGYVPPTSFAWIHLGLGEVDAAFEWMDRGVEERDQYLMPIRSYGFLDPLRADPRFEALLRKMHLDA